MNEQHNKNNIVTENNAATIKKVSSMKNGWCQTIDNTVCCYQTPFNSALLLQQESNYNILLRE